MGTFEKSHFEASWHDCFSRTLFRLFRLTLKALSACFPHEYAWWILRRGGLWIGMPNPVVSAAALLSGLLFLLGTGSTLKHAFPARLALRSGGASACSTGWPSRFTTSGVAVGACRTLPAARARISACTRPVRRAGPCPEGEPVRRKGGTSGLGWYLLWNASGLVLHRFLITLASAFTPWTPSSSWPR